MKPKAGKEWVIGLVVVVAIAFLIFGIRFMSGMSLLSSERNYYTYYSNTQGLQESADVQISGTVVGRVSKIELQKDLRVKVVFTIDKKLPLPVGSIAKLDASDLISGTKKITLLMTDNQEAYKDGDLVPAQDFSGLFEQISSDANPLLASVQHTVVSVDSLISAFTAFFNDENTKKHLNNSLANIDRTTADLSELVAALNHQSEAIAGVMKNLSSITANLEQNNGRINNTVDNLSEFSNQLAQTNLAQTLRDLEATSKNLKQVSDKLSTNDGTLGLLINDKELYENLNQSLKTVDVLLDDLKKHPAKYINLSVFGNRVKEVK